MNSNKTNAENFILTYNRNRTNLLILVALTVINIFGLFFPDVIGYFLFSCSIPYFLIDLLLAMQQEIITNPTEVPLTQSQITVFISIMVAITVIILATYILCYVFSKKNNVWNIIALVMFLIDATFFLFATLLIGDVISISSILGYVFCGYVIYCLVINVKNGKIVENFYKQTQAQTVNDSQGQTYNIVDGDKENATYNIQNDTPFEDYNSQNKE